jgi:hypothetical protein
MTSDMPALFAGGRELDTSQVAFGPLRSSRDIAENGAALRERIAQDGYLFIPGFLDRDSVCEARSSIIRELAKENAFDPSEPLELAIARPGLSMSFRPDIANVNAELQSLIYGPRVMEFYDRLLGGPSRHYDFTWMRTIAPGPGSDPHCDIIYMGRGTPDVYTAWIPLGDIPLTTGGVIILENSHLDEEVRRDYATLDVDTSCQNKNRENQLQAHGYARSGALTHDHVGLQSDKGSRWLTAEYRMGDFLTFPMFTVHGSLDNQSREIRLSSDSRYQLASEPIDERWVGEHPPGHGGNSIKGLIC